MTRFYFVVYIDETVEMKILLLGELLKWSLDLYGTATHPLQGNSRPPKQFTNRTTPSAPSELMMF